MNKKEYLENFVLNSFNIENKKSSNLKINALKDEKILINYNTRIAINKEGAVYLNNQKYSRTTSKNQSLIKYFCEKHGILYYLVNEQMLKSDF